MFILFDGDCIMCNSFLIYIDKMCSEKSIAITATGSINTFVELTNNHQNIDGISKMSKKTIVVCYQGKIMVRTRAILAILNGTRSDILNLIATAIKIIPIQLADFVYQIIALCRRKLLTKNNICAYYTYKHIRFSA